MLIMYYHRASTKHIGCCAAQMLRQRVGFTKALRNGTQIPLDFFPSILQQDWFQISDCHGIWSIAGNQPFSLINSASHTQSTSHAMLGWVSKVEGMNHLLQVPFPLHWFQRKPRQIRGDEPSVGVPLKILSRVSSEEHLKAERWCQGR